MRVLVLGGSVFLGSFVVDELLRRGHEVTLQGGKWEGYESPATHCDGDPSDRRALRDALDSWQPDCVVDMAHHRPERTENVLAECAGKVGRTVHLGDAAVYGRSPVCPVDEETEVSASSTPDISLQVEADRVVLNAIERQMVASVLIRLPELYGPRDPRCAEWFFAKRALDGRTRVAVPDAGLHICHRGFVQNMAWGIAQAVSLPRARGLYNLGEEKLYTLAQLAQGVARALNHRWEVHSVPGNLWVTPYAYTSFFDLRRARAQLRYRDRMIPRDGLELTLAWLCQNPRGEDWDWPGIETPFDYRREDALMDEFGVKLDL